MSELWIADSLFYLFALVTLSAALMVVILNNPVHAVLSLILAFLGAFGLCILIGAEFIAYALVIVYVGAVAVLFLFVVMMLNINTTAMKKGFIRYFPLAMIIGIVLLADLMLVIEHSNMMPAAIVEGRRVDIVADNTISNTLLMGIVLYTDYFFAFQMAGLILLVAMIGCIVLTLRERPGVKKQRLADQLGRTRKGGVRLVTVKSGVGLGE